MSPCQDKQTGASSIIHSLSPYGKVVDSSSRWASTISHTRRRGTDLTHKLLVHHITIVPNKDILVDNTSNGKHDKTSIAELLVLVIHPSSITVVHPVGSAEEISRFISRSLLNLLSKPFNSTTSKNKLKPSHGGKLDHSLKRIVGEGTVEGGVDASGIEVPSEAGGHGHAAVFELGFPVVFHGGIIFALRETKRIEEAGGGDDAHLVMHPCVELGGGCGGGGGSKGGAVYYV